MDKGPLSGCVCGSADRRRSSLVAHDDVVVLGSLGDDRVLATRAGRRPSTGGGGVSEAHEGEVDSLAGLRDDHPRARDRRADAERSRRVAGDDARPAADDRVDGGVWRRCGEVAAVTQWSTPAAAAGVATARDVRRYHHCPYAHTTLTFCNFPSYREILTI